MEKSRARIIAQTVGENLSRIRKEKGYTRKDIANLLNVGVELIGFYERGQTLMPLDKIFDLADFLKISVTDLTGDTGYSPTIPVVSGIVGDEIIADKIFEYRLKRAMKITSPDFLFPAQKLPTGKISIYIPAKVIRDKDGTLTFFKADDNDFIGNTVTFKDDTAFVDVVERAENFAIINYIPFYQALRAVIQNIST